MNSHDGVKDALTNLAAPALLYEELRRELARAKRSGVSICAMKIILRVKPGQQLLAGLDTTDQVKNDFQLSSMWDREILILSQSLISQTRGEDICARMGGGEFLVLLQNFNTSHTSYVERLAQSWNHRRSLDQRLNEVGAPSLEFSFAYSCSEETSLAFLNRLDLEPITIVNM